MKNIKDKFTFYNTDRNEISRYIKPNIWHLAMFQIMDNVWENSYSSVFSPILNTTYELKHKLNKR